METKKKSIHWAFIVLAFFLLIGVAVARDANTSSDESIRVVEDRNNYPKIINISDGDTYTGRIFVGDGGQISIVHEGGELLIEGGNVYIQGNLNITGCLIYNDRGNDSVLGTCN